MAFDERNGNGNGNNYARFLERNRDARPADPQQASTASAHSNHLSAELFNSLPASREMFAWYQRAQNIQFVSCQQEQQHGYLASQNGNFRPDPFTEAAQAVGASECSQLRTKFSQEEEEPDIPRAAVAAGPVPDRKDSSTTNSNNTGNSIQATGSETEGLENDMILKQLEEAIQLIPTERKQAYLESLEACDENKPSFLFQFLRRCDYNVWDAAERLVLYWQFRKDTFAERAFLPMILTGDGALTREDVLQLRAGFPAILPDTKEGLKVIFFDRSQNLPNITSGAKLRCMFYLQHVITHQVITHQDRGAQTDRLLVIILGSLPRWRNIDKDYSEFIKTAFWLAEKIVPLRLTYHILNFPPAANRRFLLQDFLYDVISNVVRHGNTQENIFVHFERQKGELLDALLDLGLTREGIPTVVGGTFSYCECVKWCQHQFSLELQENFTGGTITSDVLSSTSVSLEEKKRRRREMNLIHSRRKRERRRAVVQDIAEERDQLLGEQDSLLVEHTRLTSLLDHARQLMRTVGCLKDNA